MDTVERINPDFRPIPVGELLDGNHHFLIPSYQRGYRWDREQVLDLLEDINNFVCSDEKTYFLQPLVVKKIGTNTWEVLDGQQRLTTTLLILKSLLGNGMMTSMDQKIFGQKLYDISYKSRPRLNFDNPNERDNIDSYYVAQSKKIIEDWMTEAYMKQLFQPQKFVDCLFWHRDNEKQVKFIWYAIDESGDDVTSIGIFNRLNKGKIRLTESELIKALFVLDSENENDKRATRELTLDWDLMEKQLQKDSFWYFISPNAADVQTRMDLLFDFAAGRTADSENDYSYRQFQNLYDTIHLKSKKTQLSVHWKKLEINSMHDAWNYVKRIFDRIVHWYEDNDIYHYIGYLVARGNMPLEIFNELEPIRQNVLEEWDKNMTLDELRRQIRVSIEGKNHKYKFNKELIEQQKYGGELIERILLLFNIETYRTSQFMRFPFDAYRKEGWDIEHVDSQTQTNIEELSDKLAWLGFVIQMLKSDSDKEAKELLKDCEKTKDEFEREKRDSKNSFDAIYTKVNKYYAREEGKLEDVDLSKVDKDNIGNLALLDCGTNRSYGNAPYSYKRYCIIERDKSGRFIPLCTKNLFLKFYTSSDQDSSQIDSIRWRSQDKECYLNAIIDKLKIFFEPIKQEDNND